MSNLVTVTLTVLTSVLKENPCFALYVNRGSAVQKQMSSDSFPLNGWVRNVFQIFPMKANECAFQDAIVTQLI